MFRSLTPAAGLLDGACYLGRLPGSYWAVWRFSAGRFLSTAGSVYPPEQFERIGARVFTPEEADARELADVAIGGGE